LVGQLNGNGQKGMLQIDAPPVENFWLRHWVGGKGWDVLVRGWKGGQTTERAGSELSPPKVKVSRKTLVNITLQAASP